jgi:hypothetical protein
VRNHGDAKGKCFGQGEPIVLSPSEGYMFKDEELRDLAVEEGSRGRKQPKRAVSLERQRRLRRAVDMLTNKQCTEREYLDAIRQIAPDGTPEFAQAFELWRKLRGGGKS